jgi:hypothetical protein
MKLNDKIAGDVVRVLLNARTDTAVRLRIGARQRHALAESFKTGEPDRENYRYKWLSETRDGMLEILSKASISFKEQHPYDCISVADMIDVANSLLATLTATVEDKS